jgi:hypothetical protein
MKAGRGKFDFNRERTRIAANGKRATFSNVNVRICGFFVLFFGGTPPFCVAGEEVALELVAKIIVRGLCEERAKTTGTESTSFPRIFFRLSEKDGKSKEFRWLLGKIGTEGNEDNEGEKDVCCLAKSKAKSIKSSTCAGKSRLEGRDVPRVWWERWWDKPI